MSSFLNHGLLAATVALASGIGVPMARAAQPTADSATTWTRFVDGLRDIGARTTAKALNPQDAGYDEELYRMLATALAHGVINHLQSDPNYPDFTPGLNHVLNLAAPVPDFMYMSATITPGGVYRISGFRGSSRFVDFNFVTGQHALGEPMRSVGYVDLDKVHRDERGYFSFVISAERPKDYAGEWFALDPNAKAILVRKASYDWLNEVDPRLAIERLDIPAAAPRTAPAEISRKLLNLPKWTEHTVSVWLPELEAQRKGGVINRIEVIDYSGATQRKGASGSVIGGGATGQVYLQGLYDVADDEALILETEVPTQCRYWSVLLTDDKFATIDWLAHQSSLNGFQAKLDDDGHFRAVISNRDPGVLNWLATGGYPKGAIQFRWNNCSSSPQPTIRKVKLAQVRQNLPSSTPTVTPAERDRALRLRREGAQLRIRW